jgi:hypothetical protein
MLTILVDAFVGVQSGSFSCCSQLLEYTIIFFCEFLYDQFWADCGVSALRLASILMDRLRQCPQPQSYWAPDVTSE